MDTQTYYEIEVKAQRRVEHIYIRLITHLEEIRDLAKQCGACRGDIVELVKCVAPVRMQIGPITGRQMVTQHNEAERTTERRWRVTHARDMQLKEIY